MEDNRIVFEGDRQMPMGTAVGLARVENKTAVWLMRIGIVKSGTQAAFLLLGVAVVALAIAALAWFMQPSIPQGSTTGGGLSPAPVIVQSSGAQ